MEIRKNALANVMGPVKGFSNGILLYLIAKEDTKLREIIKQYSKISFYRQFIPKHQIMVRKQ